MAHTPQDLADLLAGVVDGILSALDDEGVDLSPIDEPEVEHFAIGDEVVLDAGGWGVPCRAIVEVADPDTAGCVTVRTITRHGLQEPGRLVTIHPRRLSRPAEAPPTPKTYEVQLGETVLLVDDGEVNFDSATMVLTMSEAMDLHDQLNDLMDPAW